MTLSIGTMVGPYEVLALIGVGGMGEVYRASDTKLKRTVAVKVVSTAVSSDPDRLARFQREGEVLASINHPNIAAIYGLEEFEGIGALIMEFVEGPTLADRLTDGPMSEAEALAIARQIAEALEVAHERGVVHRDLKPANVKVRRDGTVKVLDFGLAKIISASSDEAHLSAATTITTAAMTQSGMILGTPAYFSPEQAKGQSVDARTDIWALGCVLYEMLTGHAPFTRGSISETLARVLEHDPDWAALPAKTSSNIRCLLRRCLQKDPKRRLHSAADVRIAIEEVSVETVVEADAVPSPSRIATFVAWLVAAVAIVSAGAVWWTTVRRPSPDLAVMRLDVTTPPTNDLMSFALSPDGRSIVFVALEQQVPQLFLRRLDQTDPKRLPDTEGASHPFWDPNGRSIGFFAGGLLKRLDLAGGRPQVLAQARNPMGGAWNRDDVIVYAPSAASPIMRVAATGGTPAPVTRLAPGELSHRAPAFLRDGRRLVYLVTTRTPKDDGLYVGSLEAPGEAHRLMTGDAGAAWSPAGYLLTVREGALIAIAFDVAAEKVSGDPIRLAENVASADGHGAFSVSGSGLLAYRRGGMTSQIALAWVDRQGRTITTLPMSGYLASTRDGRHVAVARYTQSTARVNTDIWLIDAASGVSRRFTFDPAFEIFPVWSPGGDRVVFSSNRQGVFDLFEKPVSFARDEQLLLRTPTNKFPNDWSPDGHVLLFVNEDPVTGDDLWTVSLQEPHNAVRLLSGSYAESQGQFSPDGRWLTYRSNESGQWEIYLRPYPGPGSQQQVSRGGGIQPRWRGDGKELFYIAGDRRMMAVAIRPSPDGQGLEIGAPEFLFTTHLRGSLNQQFEYVVDPAGRRFLIEVAADQTSTTPITIIQNWAAVHK